MTPIKDRENNAYKTPPLSTEERKHLEEFLITVYEFDQGFVKGLTDAQVRELVRKKQSDKIIAKKNPNAFWIVKGLPVPVLPEPTGPTRHGLYIFLGFVGFLVVVIIILLAVLLT